MKVGVQSKNLKTSKKHIGILCPFTIHKYTYNDIISINSHKPIYVFAEPLKKLLEIVYLPNLNNNSNSTYWL